ncbi:MAG: hypothetical protein LUC18_02390, partial [Porphyromonadaceae bacterium]|nr:hypothetical protein [Porphyromonadaceae bacterium]
FIGQRALKSFSDKSAGAEITFSSVKIKPFNTLIVKDLAIIDKEPYTVDTTRLDSDRQRIFGEMDYRRVDTLFSAENVTATFTLRGLIGNGVILRSALIRNAQLNLVIEEYGHSINITRMFGIAEKQFRNSEPKDIFLIRKPDIENMHLTVRNYRVLKTHDIDPTGINWNDIDISDLVIHGRNLRLRGKVMSGEADFVSFKEKSGYCLESISGSVKGGGGVTTIENIHLKDSWSDINLPLLQFTYEHPWDFQHFPEKVRITSQISTTSLSLKSLSYFAPSIPRRDIVMNLSGGKVDGPVNALSITSLAFSTPDRLIRGTLSTTLKGLPDTKAMDIDASLKDLHLSSEGAQSLLTMIGTQINGLEITKYAPGVDFTLNGSLRGGLNNMKFNGYIRSSAGALIADLSVRNLLDKSSAATIGGMVRTTALNLHTIMSGIPVEEVTADAVFDSALGSDAGIRIDSLKVSGLKFKGYNYTNLFAAGTIAERRFDGKIVCNDPNLNFLLQGLLTFSRRTNNALYRFYANVGHANLTALHFDKRKRSETDFQISANFTKTGDGVWLGDVNLADLNFTDEAGTHKLGNTKIESFSGSGLYQMRLGSSFMEATFSGSAPITRFLKDVGNVTARRELPALFKNPSYEWTGENYEFKFKTFNTTELLAFIVPGVYIAGETELSLTLDKNGLLKGRMNSQRLAYKERFIKDVTLSLSNADGALKGEILGENIDLSPLSIHDNRFSLTAKDNQVDLSYSYDNTISDSNADEGSKAKTTGDRGEIRLLADMSRSEDNKTVIDVRPQPSAFQLNAKEWNILPSDILLEDKTLTVNDFKIASGDQAISVLGRLSDNFADTLDVTVNRLDLSLADALLEQSAGISGRLSGTARVTSPNDERRLLLNFQCDSASIGGERIGDIFLATKWDETFSKFHILTANSLDGETSFSLYGTYTP